MLALWIVGTTLGQSVGQNDSVLEGEKLLADLIVANKDMAQLTADYVQYRTTKLFTKPLESKGTLAFRKEPGCVVFKVTAPRTSVVRLDAKVYEVWHPERNRLERFVLPSDEMPRLLFDALAPTQARMQKGFAVESCAKIDGAPTRRLLTLLPTDAKTKRVASKITLHLDTDGPRLCGFGYQDPRGDDVRVELSEVKLGAKVRDALFALDVPKDAKVHVQQIPAPATTDDEGESSATETKVKKREG